LNHAATLRSRGLLILAGEVIFADRAADLLEHVERLALGVQRRAARPGDETRLQRRLDQVGLVLLGNRRIGNHLPRLLRLHMAGEVVLVQPVRDQHDRPLPLVVEAAVEGVVEPLVGGLALGLRQRLFRL